MEPRYKLVFVYPDGHIEEFDEIFRDEKKAIEYGESLIAQVQGTEGVMKPNGGGLFASKRKRKPYFMIVSVEEGTYHLVYESKH